MCTHIIFDKNKRVYKGHHRFIETHTRYQESIYEFGTNKDRLNNVMRATEEAMVDNIQWEA